MDKKGTAFRECTDEFERGERYVVIEAASRTPSSFGSTYIAGDKSTWMVSCMNNSGFSVAFDSLAGVDSRSLARMSRDQINAARRSDIDRSAVDVAGWK